MKFRTRHITEKLSSKNFYYSNKLCTCSRSSSPRTQLAYISLENTSSSTFPFSNNLTDSDQPLPTLSYLIIWIIRVQVRLWWCVVLLLLWIIRVWVCLRWLWQFRVYLSCVRVCLWWLQRFRVYLLCVRVCLWWLLQFRVTRWDSRGCNLGNWGCVFLYASSLAKQAYGPYKSMIPTRIPIADTTIFE